MIASVARVSLFPATFTGALVAAVWGQAQGWSPDALMAGIILVVVLIVGVCEFLLPAYPEWTDSQGDVGTDLIHALVSMIMLPPLLELGVKVLILSMATTLVGTALLVWPTHWHVAAQLLLAMIVTQFFEYWAHRLMHEVPLLWRLHATHHSPGRLYWLNAARFHPIDTGATFSLSMFSLLVLGAGEELLMLVAVWTAVHGLFQHANIDVRLGPLNWIFSMAELHRWHHSRKLEEANNNYGNNILLWDIIFGTVFWPRDRRADPNIGLKDMDDFPTGYLGQIASPFRWRW